MKADRENDSLIDGIIRILEESKLQSRDLNPQTMLLLLRRKLASTSATYRCYELLDSYLIVGFLSSIYDMYFNYHITPLSRQELDKSNIKDEFRNMIKREFEWLSRTHFDDDYILLYKELKGEMSTLSQIAEVIEETELEEIESEIVKSIGRATDGVLDELKKITSELLENILSEVKEKRSIKALEDCIRKYAKEKHSQIVGWP